MKTSIGHLQINIDPQNIPFYKELLSFLGWSVIYEDPNMLGIGSNGASLWFTAPLKEIKGDYDGTGMNHIGLSAAVQSDVDQAVTYLKKHSIPALFNTPCHRPEFSAGPDKTYYQVMFESPDRILFEVVYTGDKS
jgi:hypothetical protein